MLGVAPVSVVIACHYDRRWSTLIEAIASVRIQRPAPKELVVVVDHNQSLFDRLRSFDPALTVIENRYQQGASGARNTGAESVSTDTIAFLDDDAVAHPGWLSDLLDPLSDDNVIGTGGAVHAVWNCPRPTWFPDEFAWVVGASHTGQPVKPTRIRNVWALNMAVKRSVFEEVGGFRVGFGKVGSSSRPEDTDLCIRMRAVKPAGSFLYVPSAIVDHHVPPDRSTYRYFITRCYEEGRGKTELARHLGTNRDLAMERDWLRRTVPRGIWINLQGGLLGRRSGGCSRAGAMMSGLVAAAAGSALSYAKSAKMGRSAGAYR
jgi:GT2 family glycosyltransferase